MNANGGDIYAKRISGKNQISNTLVIAKGIPPGDGIKSLHPAVAYNPSSDQYLVVYMYESSANIYEVRGKTVAWDGSGLSSELVIATEVNRSHLYPRVAHNNIQNEYMVVWNAYSTLSGFPPGTPVNVSGKRVNPNGTMSSVITFYSTNGPHSADITFNHSTGEYFTVFSSTQALPGGNNIYGLRSDFAGTIINPPGVIPLATNDLNQDHPIVTTKGSDHYLIVWEHELSATDIDIYSMELNQFGNMVAYYAFFAGADRKTDVSLAVDSSSNDWLMSWMVDAGSGESIQEVYKSSAIWQWDLPKEDLLSISQPVVLEGKSGYLIAYKGVGISGLRVFTVIRIFPWGNTNPTCSRANSYNDSCIGYCVGDTVSVVSYLSGGSPDGLLNMAGNVLEWVNDWYKEDYYLESQNSTNPQGPATGTYRAQRGGSWRYLVILFCGLQPEIIACRPILAQITILDSAVR